LQLADRNVRRRGTVGLFHVPEQSLQSRILVSNHPSAPKHFGLMEARYAHDLGGAGETGVEIISRWNGHSITRDLRSPEIRFAMMTCPADEFNHRRGNHPRYSPVIPVFVFCFAGGYSAACKTWAFKTWALRPARTSRPGSAPVCSPRSKIGVPATSVAS